MDYGLVRIALALTMLGIAAFLDLRKREVSDLLWLIFAIAAGILYVFDFPSIYAEMTTIIISVAFTAGISFGIYRSGLFGGADMLCLIVLAAIVPTFNENMTRGILPITQTTFHPIVPIMVLTNALILSLMGIVINVARNLSYAKNSGYLFEGLEHEPSARKAIALLIGHRQKRQAQYTFPIETTIDGKRKFNFGIKSAEDTEYELRHDVWVMSGQPLLTYMLAGFIVFLLIGDLAAVSLSFFRLF